MVCDQLLSLIVSTCQVVPLRPLAMVNFDLSRLGGTEFNVKQT